MDYTDLARVKAAMDSAEAAADATLGTYITAASRLIDRLVTGVPNGDNYFALASVADEILSNGAVDWIGRLTVYPRKAVINSVSAMAYRFTLADSWSVIDTALTFIEDGAVMAEAGITASDRIFAKISYSGGYGTTVATLPPDIVDAATIMAVRLYKEARSGLVTA